jgi:uncharacterized protein DUF4153
MMPTVEGGLRVTGLLALRRRPAPTVAVAALVAGLLTDLAVRSGAIGLSGTLLVVMVAAAVAAAGRRAGWQPVLLAAGAGVFGLFLTLRTSPWLVPLDVLAAALLLVLAASLASGGSLFDLPLPALAVRAVGAALHGLAAPAFVHSAFGPIERRRGGLAAVLRGLALAAPLLIVLGALLAMADALFLHFLSLAPDTSQLFIHAVLIGLGAWGMAGLLRLASAVSPDRGPALPRPIGGVEATVVLGSLVVLLGAFAVTQLVAVSEGGRRVLERQGLTYADYARSGFFELLAAAFITALALLAVVTLTDAPEARARRRLVILGGACVALTLVMVGSALHRLGLYQQAYGLTMLRLYARLFAWLVGAGLLALGAWLAGAWRSRDWLFGAVLVVGIVTLLGLNLANPEAMVVRANLAHAERTGRFDPAYLGELSDDAIPQLVRASARLPEGARAEVLKAACSMPPWPYHGWGAWNHSRQSAQRAVAGTCPR